ncbi:MAG: hypothetical protein DIJKHBIC_02332 [Thermoanaerobaculia bacterium]|nr:hypothetical protein [Thermoanaerobaculia bacterium]
MVIEYKTITNEENGARFHTADLHVHSFGGSADVRDVAMTVEAIIESAVRNKIALLAITDHNCDRNLEAALAYAAKYSERLLVIPGVEITTAHGHLLGYFPPERVRAVRDLLATLRIEGEYGSRDSHTAMSMADVIDHVERLGGLCIAAHIDRPKMGFETLADGYPNWKRDILTRSGLYGLEYDDAAHLAWFSTDDEPTPTGGQRRKLLGLRATATATAARIALAAVQGSDAHSLKDFEEQHQRRCLTRFKMNELSFEAFRTALIDPEARVRASASIPRSFPRVLGMHLAGGFLDGCTVRFSDNLSCFIGGRGTGKSTAIRSLTYGLGSNDSFEDMDNCPDTTVIYCEDAAGIKYRYERNRGRAPSVRALENQSISEDVPVDAFRIESYAQGELSDIGRDPIGNPSLFQEFLDRHIVLADLRSREQELEEELRQNSAQLIPLETLAAQLPAKERELVEVDTKLRLAETGKLKDLVTFQSHVAAEKSIAKSLRDLQRLYGGGVSLAKWRHDFDGIVSTAGTVTSDPGSTTLLAEARSIVEETNAYTEREDKRVTDGLAERAGRLQETLSKLDARHRDFDRDITAKVTAFQQQGLSGDLAGLNNLLTRRSTLSGEAARIKAQSAELAECRARRLLLLSELGNVRGEIGKRRKAQLAPLNKQLRETIDDYAINVYYEPGGVRSDYCSFVQDVMRGTYLQEDAARAMCVKMSPAQLVDAVKRADSAALEGAAGATFGPQILTRFRALQTIHALELIATPDKPVIKVVTKGSDPRQIPANQLSDGQKHTILLTIALLAESNLPLVIDQPEDDLDNAFISSSVVRTLRAVKERRQVIVVTHNANIAVLGDSELILPMSRSENRGQISERGSIDRKQTSNEVQNILEGGREAFRRRNEIYGY